MVVKLLYILTFINKIKYGINFSDTHIFYNHSQAKNLIF